MTITSPTLTLKFGSDITTTTQTITSQYINRRSISFSRQLFNNLTPSSNRVALKIDRNCPVIDDILKTEENIKTTLKDGNTTLFTGYLSTSLTWGVDTRGKQITQLTIEDVGTRLLTENFITSGYYTFNTTLSLAVGVICLKAGVTVSSSAVFPNASVMKAIEGTHTCKELLTKLLSEVNCVYYFDSLGELRCKEINCSSVASLPTFDKTNLYAVGGSSVKVSKNLRQYKNARVSYSEVGSADNYCVFHATKVPMGGGQKYDGLEVYTPSGTRTPAYIEGVNALSEQSLVGSNKILFLTSPSLKVMGSSLVSGTVSSAGGRFLNISAENLGNIKQTPTLSVYASIKYEKSQNIITTENDSNNDQVLEESLEWVHTKALAEKRANLLAQYHRYAKTQYTFYSTDEVALGTVVRLHDDEFSGLDVNVMLYASHETDESDVIQYSAVGVAVYNLVDSVDEDRSSGATKNEPIISTQPNIYADENAHFEATGEFASGATFEWYVNKQYVGSGASLDLERSHLLFGDNLVECEVTEGASTRVLSTHLNRGSVPSESEIDMDSTTYDGDSLLEALRAQCQGNPSGCRVIFKTGSVKLGGVEHNAPIALQWENTGEYGYVLFYDGFGNLIYSLDFGYRLETGDFIHLSNAKPPVIADYIYTDGEIGNPVNRYVRAVAAEHIHAGGISRDVVIQDEGGSILQGTGNVGDTSSWFSNAYFDHYYKRVGNNWEEVGGKEIRCGVITGLNNSGESSKVISFDTPFPNHCQAVVLTPASVDTSDAYGRWYAVTNIFKTSFTMFVKNHCTAMRYIAIGD